MLNSACHRHRGLRASQQEAVSHLGENLPRAPIAEVQGGWHAVCRVDRRGRGGPLRGPLDLCCRPEEQLQGDREAPIDTWVHRHLCVPLLRGEVWRGHGRDRQTALLEALKGRGALVLSNFFHLLGAVLDPRAVLFPGSPQVGRGPAVYQINIWG